MSLEGRYVLVTRPGDAGVTLAREIERLGGESCHAPAIRVVLLPDSSEAKGARDELLRADRLLLTSRNGLLGLLGARTADDFPVKPPSLWAVGGGTAAIAMDRRFRPAVTVSSGGLEANGHLGLRLLADLAAKTGGTLSVDSEPGKGTRVVLEGAK